MIHISSQYDAQLVWQTRITTTHPDDTCWYFQSTIQEALALQAEDAADWLDGLFGLEDNNNDKDEKRILC